MQQLVDRFKESFVPIDENGDVTWPSFESADFDATNRDDRQRAEAHKLAMAAQDASQNPAQLVKLRQHFQKVPLSRSSTFYAWTTHPERLWYAGTAMPACCADFCILF